MKCCLTYFSFIFVGLLFAQISSAHMEQIDGEWKEMAFFPNMQSYKVIESKPLSFVQLADDLSGIPRILAGSYVHFAPDYFTMKEINSGGEYVINACFQLTESQLIAYPQGRFQKAGSKFIFSLSDGALETVYGQAAVLKLKKTDPPDGEAERRSRYEKLLTKIRNKQRNNHQYLPCEEYLKRRDFIENRINKEAKFEELVSLLKEIDIKGINANKNPDSTIRKLAKHTKSNLPIDQIRQIFIEEQSASTDCKAKDLLDNYPDIAHKALALEISNKMIRTYKDSSISADEVTRIKAVQRRVDRKCSGKLGMRVIEKVANRIRPK